MRRWPIKAKKEKSDKKEEFPFQPSFLNSNKLNFYVLV
jgi:hypothetical protein